MERVWRACFAWCAAVLAGGGLVLTAPAAVAQTAEDVVWVQIEAYPSVAEARARAQLFAQELEDVNGFALPSGWFAIAVGPYLESDARQVLRVYRSEGVIPRDSYIALSSDYREQFFPRGANLLGRGTVTAAAPAEAEAARPDRDAVPDPDETPAEARRSERLLTAEERRELQIALQWAGYYTAAIDGAFGRGTRAAMAAWQDAQGIRPTGVLTTAQRADLLRQYNAVLEGLGVETVRDTRAGIEIRLPMGVLADAPRYDYPFAEYDAASDEMPARVLLISQAGNQDTLFGLYEIMQTLEIVPLDGPRERNTSSFTLVGRNARIVSHTEASLQGGAVKGFTLIWPTGDEERRTRLLAEMRESFTPMPGALDPTWSDNETQAVDLLAGLQVRTPRLSRSGFFVSDRGAVVTTAETVSDCGRVTIDSEVDARVVAADSATGLALLEPQTALSPRAVAEFSAGPPRLRSEVAVAGYSYGGLLGAPTVSFGALADLRGLQGEETLARLDVDTLDGDAGGPVFDAGGAVMGMLLPRPGGDRQLPDAVAFALQGDAIRAILAQNGVSARTRDGGTALAPEDITARARDMTVLVDCWD